MLAAVVLSVRTDTFATPQNLFNVTRNFAFVAIIALGHDGGDHLRRHRSVGRLDPLPLGDGAGVVMNAGYLRSGVGIAAAARRSLAGWTDQRRPDRLCRDSALRGHARHAVDRPQPAMVLVQNKMIYQFGPDEKLLSWLGGGSTFGIANPVDRAAPCWPNHRACAELDALGLRRSSPSAATSAPRS